MEGKVAVITGYIKSANESILINCISALTLQSYPNFDIFVYDNSVNEPESLKTLRERFPKVKIKKNNANLGFAGGNNSVIRDLLNDPEYEYIVLLNDDTEADSDWLKNLIKKSDTDQKIGSVTSKLIFFEEFVRVEFRTQTFNPKTLGLGEDSRDLGLKLFSSTKFKNSDYLKKFYRSGCYGFEGDFLWTKDSFVVDLPIGQELQSEYHLVLEAEANGQTKDQTVEIKIGSFKTSINLTQGVKTYEVAIPAQAIQSSKFNLIQNAGSGISAQFNGYDVGNVQKPGEVSSSAEVDEGQYDQPREVEMICGCAVLFKTEVLRKVGIFDEYFFTYYEDSDLSLRIKKAGYKLIYEPTAVVRHMHATSSNENSPFFLYHVLKNKPAFVLKNFNVRPNLSVMGELLTNLVNYFNLAAKSQFASPHPNMLLKVDLKSILKFTVNIPLLLLKRFNIIKCN